MSNSKSNSSGFSQEDINEILREEERENVILEEIRKSREPYEDTLCLSNYDRELYKLPSEAETEYCMPPRYKKD